MTLDKMQTPSNPRKKVTTGVVLLVVFILVWQISSMFGKAASSPPKAGGEGVAVAQTPAAAPPPAPATQMKPKPADLSQATPMSDREKALITLQQETQAKYLEALNELQMLKVTRDIALTNKDISTANLGRVESEKKIVDMLAGPATPPPASTTVSTQPTVGLQQNAISYTVVSISEVQYRWGAVLSYAGTLYNVHVGDVLPADGATVVAISKESVTLQKNGTQKRISLVSII